MKHRSMKAALFLSLALSSGACAWSKFDDLEAQATVRTFDVPESYRVEKYGAVITSYQGKAGTKEECLAYVETVWTDMTPASLRQKVGDDA